MRQNFLRWSADAAEKWGFFARTDAGRASTRRFWTWSGVRGLTPFLVTVFEELIFLRTAGGQGRGGGLAFF